jgi:hypothetical protein
MLHKGIKGASVCEIQLRFVVLFRTSEVPLLPLALILLEPRALLALALQAASCPAQRKSSPSDPYRSS